MKLIRMLSLALVISLAHCHPVYSLELGDLPVIKPTVFTLRMGDDRIYVTWQSPKNPANWFCYYQETDEFYGVGSKMPITDVAQVIPPTATSPTPWTLEALLLAAAANPSSHSLGDLDVTRCNALRDAVIYKWPQLVVPVTPLSKTVVAHNAAKTTLPDDRPLLDPVTFKQIGTQRVLAGTACEDAELKNAVGTVYHMTTNAAGVRGATVCTLRK